MIHRTDHAQRDIRSIRGADLSGWEPLLQKWFIPLLLAAIVVNAGGLFIPILEPDGSLYAGIAKTIAHTGDFINLRVEGKDWLDKPHFPFWMAAISFRLLGVSAFAYKLPALLFWAAGAWYTWRLAMSLYGKSVAQLATLIYVSAAHLVISNNDVRAEPYLTALVIGAVYHFYRASRSKPRWTGGPSATTERSEGRERALAGGKGEVLQTLRHLAAGSFLAGCACMTKGPFVVITIGAGFILDWIIGKDWEQFRNIRWWIAIALTALATLPELYCLYVQFDLHPEKLVYGHTHVSGIRFFFWDSQFGRFFNTGPIKGSGDPFFYFHTLLWAFLPWSLLLYAAVVQKCRRSASHIPGDWICLGGALVSFIVFSLSRFQLPHYLNILFPFFAILTADYLYGIRRPRTQKIIRIVQDSINVLLPLLVLALCWFFHFDRWLTVMILVIGLAIAPFLVFRGPRPAVPIARSFWMAMLVFAFVNFSVYPTILDYQAGTQAGHWLASSVNMASLKEGFILPRRTPPLDDTAYLLSEAPVDYSFEFDCPRPVRRLPMDSLVHKLSPGLMYRRALVFAPTTFADSLSLRGMSVTDLHRFPNFHISQLTGEFVNYRTRASVLTPWSLMLVERAAAVGPAVRAGD